MNQVAGHDTSQPFRVHLVDYDGHRDLLHAIRETVFVGEQDVPPELERDALDPQCAHVLARALDGTPIGTGRLTPEHRTGRMAVLSEWRGKGVGDAMLDVLVGEARARGWREVALNAQAGAIDFYLRHGFVPQGPRFQEAGIEHQALRRFATAGRGGTVRILLQDAAAPQRSHAPLLALAQRLPSIFQFREVADPVDRAYPSAFIASDAGGYYFRTLGHRFDGEADLHGPGRARQLGNAFDLVWERSRPVSEYRALGI